MLLKQAAAEDQRLQSALQETGLTTSKLESAIQVRRTCDALTAAKGVAELAVVMSTDSFGDMDHLMMRKVHCASSAVRQTPQCCQRTWSYWQHVEDTRSCIN